MKNNDILRRVRYIFDYSDDKMIKIFAHANETVTRAQVCNWLKKDDEPEFIACNDLSFSTFLNGFIIEKRGKKEGPSPEPEKQLNNNLILNKLKIALNLKAEDIIEILATTGITVGKSELSAFFRKPNHKNYRRCLDQFLRNFLEGITIKYREGGEVKGDVFQWENLKPAQKPK